MQEHDEEAFPVSDAVKPGVAAGRASTQDELHGTATI